jgi:biopolymer transport protein ExbD
MSEINTGGGEAKKGKPKKMNLRVDFTPMVDMNMLLLTFFMFCTSLSKPQIMNLVLPVKDDQVLKEDEQNKVKDSKAITLLLGKSNKVYYYLGKVDVEKYKNWESLQETNYAADGLRGFLLERNSSTVKTIKELEKKKKDKQIGDEGFEKEMAKLKDDPDGQVVVIKPSDDASYENVVDALDEMQICSIGKYALIEMSEGDKFLLENYLSKGEYGKGRQFPK